jgi:hypothetical protein
MLQLAVAIRTDEYALGHLSLQLRIRRSVAIRPDAEGLRRGIYMMEVQTPDAAIVSTKDTSPAGLLHKSLNETPTIVGLVLRPTRPTAPPPLLANKYRFAVTRAYPDDRLLHWQDQYSPCR